jgi:hypothetical protein
MRSSPSLDRGRFVLPRDLFAAGATAATLVAAVLVVGWLAGGLIAGVWSPREQAATVGGAAVTLAAPSDRHDARRRVSVSQDQSPTAPPPARARADAVRGERSARRAPRHRRRAAAAPLTASPSVQAPVPAPVATATPAAAAMPVTAPADAAPVETADTSTRATSEAKRSSQLTTEAPAAPSRRPERSSAGGDDQGRRPTSPAPAAQPAPVGDHGGADQHGHGRGGH